jgi:hypothetical protein
MTAPNGQESKLSEEDWLIARTPQFKAEFGDWERPTKYTANNVDDPADLERRYPSTLERKYYHHSTNVYGRQAFDSREGEKQTLHIIGRLTTDKVDVLVVENPNSKNETAHITLAVKKGVPPVTSNTELKEHRSEIVPLDDYVETTFRNNLRSEFDGKMDKNGEPLEDEIRKFKLSINPVHENESEQNNKGENRSNQPKLSISPEEAKAYMDAAKKGDEDTAREMVADAARRAMPDTKVVDKDGNPIVVYHGTNLTRVNNSMPFWVFNEDSHFGTKKQASEAFIRSTRNKELSKIYGVYLDIKNPKRVDDVPQDWIKEHTEYWEPIIRQAKEEGYDGLVYQNTWEASEQNKDSYVAFYPEQIKSADPITRDDAGNIIPLEERFNRDNDDIRFSISTDDQGNAYDAGDMPFDEKISKGLADLAQKNKDSVELRVRAMRAIGGNLSNLRRAMSLQRSYDKGTVDSIVRMANMMMGSGIYTGFSPYEVKRLMGMVNRAAGREDITKEADNVVDMMLNHQLKELQNMLSKQLRTKATKIDNNPKRG